MKLIRQIGIGQIGRKDMGKKITIMLKKTNVVGCWIGKKKQ